LPDCAAAVRDGLVEQCCFFVFNMTVTRKKVIAANRFGNALVAQPA